MPIDHDQPSEREHERLHPGAGESARNNAQGRDSAALPGGSDEDIRGRRGRTAGAQAGHGAKTAEGEGQRGDAAQPSASSDYTTGRSV